MKTLKAKGDIFSIALFQVDKDIIFKLSIKSENYTQNPQCYQ